MNSLSTLPEYRTDPISGETVIIAPSRASRPNALASVKSVDQNDARKAAASCPFCRGREDRTPETLAVYPNGTSHDDWQVRVVSNLYPAVTTDANATNQPSVAFGQHEVVIEGPEHVSSVTELTPEQLRWTVQAYTDRMLAHRDAGAAYTQIFKNNGRAAGASLAHSHSQIASLDRVPPRIEQELRGCHEFAAANRGCLICDVIRNELDAGERIVIENDDWVIYCPFASRLPYELCMAPRKHQPHFWAQDDAIRDSFARTLYQIVSLLEKMEKWLPFNYLIHTAPFDIAADGPYHWHMELLPRLARHAGFEWGTGLHLNSVAPEAAAAELRQLRM